MPLAMCREHDNVVIHTLDGSGFFRKRMLELGLTPGTTMHVLRYAPLRDPMELRVRGCCISIRIDEARLIHVRVPASCELPSTSGDDR